MANPLEFDAKLSGPLAEFDCVELEAAFSTPDRGGGRTTTYQAAISHEVDELEDLLVALVVLDLHRKYLVRRCLGEVDADLPITACVGFG